MPSFSAPFWSFSNAINTCCVIFVEIDNLGESLERFAHIPFSKVSLEALICLWFVDFLSF